MKIQLHQINVRTKKTTEQVKFSEVVTFVYGPIGKGKSTVARLVNFCFGGDLERTPAIQQEFVSVELLVSLGTYSCVFERGLDDRQSVRVSWVGPKNEHGSINAPLSPQDIPLLDAEVYNLSDLIFHLCGVEPIKVRQRSRDPESPLIRLSFRDIWRYCYLDQTHLDSSFFRLEDPFRGRKSQDAMRFFTGLHSERLSQLESDLMRLMDEQRAKREAVEQIRSSIARFELEGELGFAEQIQAVQRELSEAEKKRDEIEQTRLSQIHPTDVLRSDLRNLSEEIEIFRQAILDSKEAIEQQRALRGEFITAKTKAQRTARAGEILEGVHYHRCPQCGTDISERSIQEEQCNLCGSIQTEDEQLTANELEIIRHDLNDRIDQNADSIARREYEVTIMERQLKQTTNQKFLLDQQLQAELARYDSSFIESIRAIEREIATLVERLNSLTRLQQMPQAVDALEEEARALQGRIDRIRSLILGERGRLQNADANISAIAEEFKRIMLAISYPGVSEEDDISIDPRNWRASVFHDDQEWSFWDTGSGGKKTLFNVCYALAVHKMGYERGMPVPNLLIIDSPTKNISEDENPELVQSLYSEIYKLAIDQENPKIQFLLIDSNFVAPGIEMAGFSERRMAGEPDAPSLISYYDGP